MPGASKPSESSLRPAGSADATFFERPGFFRLLVDTMNAGLGVRDVSGRIVYVNDHFCDMLGYRPCEVIGRQVRDFLEPGSAEAFTAEMEKRPTSESSSYELTMVAKGGELVPTLHSGRAIIGEDGAFLGSFAVVTNVAERKQVLERLRHDALHDALTRLPNRVLFMDRLGHALDRNRRGEGDTTALLYLDLDRFKTVNDRLGHALGDLLLVEAGRRLRGCLRPNDTLARLGGDEFAILIEDVKDPSAPVRVAERVRTVLAAPFDLEGREVYTTSSIGIALSQGSHRSPGELLRDADTAMYRAKSRGRDGYALFDAEMHAQVRAQLKLETALRRAVDQWQFEVLYQPILDLGTGRVAGMEALVRWLHPERGMVLPNEFINLAEETGLMRTLGGRVLAEACLQMKEWQDRFERPDEWFVAVNLSSRQLAEHDLADQVRRVLAESGLAASSLVLELTEGVVMERAEAVAPILALLKERGVRLSLDDFGTGPSSLAVLHRFPFDMVKIDHGFVGHVGVDPGSDELIDGVMALCRWRRLATVAEGVETEEQRRRLLELGCAYAQGFLFAEPGSSDQAEKILRDGI